MGPDSMEQTGATIEVESRQSVEVDDEGHVRWIDEEHRWGPLTLDERVPAGTIEFRNADGDVVGTIVLGDDAPTVLAAVEIERRSSAMVDGMRTSNFSRWIDDALWDRARIIDLDPN